MLDALRRGTGSWIAKIFIALLVVSFAVWGIADIFRGYGAGSLAEVGGQEVSAEQYRFAYQTELRRVANQLGRSLTTEEARAIGLDQRVLARLIGEAAVEAHAKELNLGITDKAIAQQTVNEPLFQDAAGRFSRGAFIQVLQANGLSEQRFIALERESSVRRQLTQTVGEIAALPEALLQAANRYQNEQRALSYFVLPETKIDPIPAPTEEQLKSHYEDNKQAYTAPEYRKLGVLIVTPELLAGTIEVNEADIKQRYETRKDSFGKPERRHVLQIAFPDKATALEAADKIRQGTDFIEVAKTRGYTEKDIDLGRVTRSEVLDPAVAEAAFKLAKDAVSEPVEGRFGTVLLKVSAIEPGVEVTFDDVKAQIRDAIAKERAAAEALDLHDKVEDERAAGTKLSQIADKLNLKYAELPAVGRDARSSDGKTIDVPSAAQVAAAAFESDVGIENDPIETSDRGFVWVDVLGLAPEHRKAFDAVRAQVQDDWRKAELRARLAKKAQELVDRIRKGETIAAVAQALQLQTVQSKPFKRGDNPEALPRAAVALAFALAVGGSGSAPAEDGASRVVLEVARIDAPPPLSESDADALRKSLQAQITDDFIDQYVAGLRDRYGVKVNRAQFNQLTGRDGS